MLAFVGSDVGDGGKDVGCVRCCTFDAVSVVYASLPSFGVNIKVLQIIIKVDRSSAEIASKECSVCSEDGGDVYSPFLRQRKSHSCEPFMKVGNDRSPALMGYKL